MSTASPVPETWELTGDDAWRTLERTGRFRLVADDFRRFRAAACLALGVGRSIAASLGSPTSVRIWGAIRWPVGLVLAMAAMALLFRWSPRRRQPAWSWLAFGSFVSVGLWAISTVGLSLSFR